MTERISALTQIAGVTYGATPTLIGGTAPPPPPPTRSPRLFTPTMLARLQARWNDSAYATLVSLHKTATDGFSVALRYAATGDTTGINAAVTTVLAQSYTLYNANPIYCYTADPSVFLLDLCYNVLTSAQRSALIAQIESNTAQREAQIPATFRLHEVQYQGFHAYVFGCLAAQGEPGFTDRAASLRNSVQNYLAWLAEIWGDGSWCDYAYQASYFLSIPVFYGIATGQDMRALVPWAIGRPGYVARTLATNGADQITAAGDQAMTPVGFAEAGLDASANEMSMIADYWRDPVAQLVGNKIKALKPAGSNPGSHGWPWQGLVFYDDTLEPAADLTGLGLSWSGTGPGSGYAHMRSGWNAEPETRVWVYGGPIRDHGGQSAAALNVWRGDDPLFTYGRMYNGTSSPYSGFMYNSLCQNCLHLAPAGSATPDADGKQHIPAGADVAASSVAFPVADALSYTGVTPVYLHSKFISFSDDGAVVKGVWDMAKAYVASQGSAHKRTVWYVRASNVVLVWDTWTAPAAGLSRARQIFWSKVQPQGAAPAIIQGSGSAGILQPQPSSVVVTKGGSAATLQALSPLLATRFIGGVGYEQWVDGANVPVPTLAQGGGGGNQALNDARTVWVTGQWRTEIEVAPTSTEILTAITVGASGSVAPVLSITPGSPRTITVGGSTIQVT